MRVTIEKMVYGGAGLARTEHGVVFVQRTAPGDVVEVELVERKADLPPLFQPGIMRVRPDPESSWSS